MAIESVGYARLINKYGLACILPTRTAVIDTSVKGRVESNDTLRLEPKYRPSDKLSDDLQFAFRYEGINLQVLHFLFRENVKDEIQNWVNQQTESKYARQTAFLYEWLTNDILDSNVPSKASYVPLLDERLQFGMSEGDRNQKFRIINNLPGNQNFCPMVWKTEFLNEIVNKNLKLRTQETLAKYDPDLLRRAAAYLYLKETQSSFEVEREKPSPTKAQRFADLLRETETGQPLSEDRFVELQNAVLDPRFQDVSYRNQQNWIGENRGYRNKISLVPARPEDVRDLMEGLVQQAERFRQNSQSIDAVIMAASVAFGFVFIHPFMDGNGRLHRYLIHEILSAAGFTPKGIVLPVSAVILANLDQYVEVLDAFSKPLVARTEYNPDTPNVSAIGNDAIFFKYFDATEQASFLYRSLENTVENDLQNEIAFLIGFDKARSQLNALFDWPPHSLDLFIRLVHQNNYELSKTKKQSHFEWLSDDEIAKFQSLVRESFSTD
ncbi:Fic family protein [Methylotenera sp.]|uniref:Fic family protein n=1 Tax=Methylotenera sp. TaxID=2051956 RepID=UPI002ED800DF